MTWRRLIGVLLALAPVPIHAQTLDDSLLTPKKALFTGVTYGHNSWTEYWEGTLKRENGNVGELTTRSFTWMGNYGVTRNLNVIVMLPFVSTKSSGGTLDPQKGLQDLTLGAKYRLLDAEFGDGSALQGFGVASYAFPVSDYVADLFPLSIGFHSQRLSGRMTANYRRRFGWFADATAAYTRRGNVTLDRPAYYTDGQLFLTDEVEMPDVFDCAFRLGYMNHGLMIPITYTRYNTLGGGDIRRQDMPFVSNRMNFSTIAGMVMYTLPRPADLAVKVEVAHVLTGRNVGQSTAVTAGVMYTLRFGN